MATEPTRCGCPGPYNTISSQGACDRCGVEGPLRRQAVREALASGRYRLAAEIGRAHGRQAGYGAGVEEGRRQAIEALLEREVGRRPKARERELDYELELGA